MYVYTYIHRSLTLYCSSFDVDQESFVLVDRYHRIYIRPDQNVIMKNKNWSYVSTRSYKFTRLTIYEVLSLFRMILIKLFRFYT